MELDKVYEQYKSLNNQLQTYLEKFIATEEVTCDQIKPTLEDVKTV